MSLVVGSAASASRLLSTLNCRDDHTTVGAVAWLPSSAALTIIKEAPLPWLPLERPFVMYHCWCTESYSMSARTPPVKAPMKFGPPSETAGIAVDLTTSFGALA